MLKIKAENYTNDKHHHDTGMFKKIVGNIYWYKGKYQAGQWQGYFIGSYMYFKFLYRIYLKMKSV